VSHIDRRLEILLQWTVGSCIHNHSPTAISRSTSSVSWNKHWFSTWEVPVPQ